MATNTALLERLKGTSRLKLALGFLGLVIAVVLPQLGVTKDIEGPLPIATVVLMAVYALFALGLNIVVGFAGLLDLGFVAFFLFGAYVSAWLMSDFAIQVTGRGGAWKTSVSTSSPLRSRRLWVSTCRSGWSSSWPPWWPPSPASSSAGRR